MKHIYFFIIAFILFLQRDVMGQLPNGSIAPNWTLTDIEGNTFTLYDYLDAGKMVVIDFGETRCTPCWEYLNSGELETFWEEHGPNGLDDAMVFFIEANWDSGMDDLLGLTPFSNGNWIEACPYPLIDLAPGDVTALNYGVTYYPTIFAICQDHTLYEMGMATTQEWVDFLESCNMEVEVSDLQTAVCAGDGSVTVEGIGGFSPYTYEWETGETVPTISDLISGNYSVTVTEGNGKISTLDVFVPGATEPLSITDEVEPALCYGSASGNIFIDVEGGVSAYNYDWSNGSNAANLLNITSDNYSVTVTDNLGCTIEQSFFVDQPDAISVDEVATPVSCDQDDGTITLSITGGVGNYEITSSAGNVIGNQIVGLGIGSVSFEVEDGNGCTWTGNMVMQYIDTPVASVTEGAEINCIQTATILSGFATGGYNEFDFHWTTADGHIISDPLNAEIGVDAPGSYLLHVTDLTSGCETFATSVVNDGVVIPDVDAGPVIPINCENLQVYLAASGDPLNLVSWSTPDGHLVSGFNTYQPLIDAPGTYVIDVVNSVTQCVNQDFVIIPDESVPAVSVFQYFTSSLTIAGTDLSTGSSLTGWNWTFGDGQSSNEQNPVHTYATPGSYQVCLTVQNGCGTNQSCQQVEVAFAVSPLTVTDTITPVLCHGERTGSINVVVTGGSGNYTYNWTGPDTTYMTSFIDSLPAGNYQLIVTDGQGNNFIGAYVVGEPTSMNADSVVIANNPCAGMANGSLTVFVSGGVGPYSYSWNGGPFESTNTITQLPGGIIVGDVVDANECHLFFQDTLVDPSAIVLDSAVVTDASGANASDGSITLIIRGGTEPYTIAWNNGATGSEISGLSPGTYVFAITDANGCFFGQDSVVVSFITSTNYNLEQPVISIFPNPTNGYISIRTNVQAMFYDVTILNTAGTEMMKKDFINGMVLDMSILPQGLYIARLTDGKKVYYQKLIRS